MEMPFLSLYGTVQPEKLFGLSRHATTPTEGVPLQFRHRTYDDAGSLLRLSAVARNTAHRVGANRFRQLRDRQLKRRSLRHRLRSIASRQDARPIAQHDQPARILGNPASIDCASDRQVIMPVNDLFLASVVIALRTRWVRYF